MRAYSELYVKQAQRTLGSTFDFAHNGCEVPLLDLCNALISSGIFYMFALGSPCVVAGKSGCELVLKVVRSGFLQSVDYNFALQKANNYAPVNGASKEYWTGWALAYFQWDSGWNFDAILEAVPVQTITELYYPYHEMDITQFCERMDELIQIAHKGETMLKKWRHAAALSQSDLAKASGVPLRTLQQYEQRQKDINKAQVQYVVALARVLHCNVEDLLEHKSTPYYEYEIVSLK
jgi:DNA-binding transcriptional regulator YiaG